MTDDFSASFAHLRRKALHPSTQSFASAHAKHCIRLRKAMHLLPLIRQGRLRALIYWAKTGMREFTMRDEVNDYLEASGTNRPTIGGEETILAHRKIAANRLAIDCIYALSKEELSKVDRELEGIVGNLPLQHKGVKR